MQKTSSLAIAAAVMMLTVPQASEAQLGGVITAIAGRQIIQEGSKAVDDGLDHATASGNALIAQTSSSLSILIQTISMELGGDIDHLDRALRPDEINLLAKIRDLTSQLNGLQNAAYDFKDSTVIDLSTLAAALPFVHLPYFIQRIRGLSQVVSDGDYHMSVAAYGLTPGSQNTNSAVRLIDENTNKEIPTQVSISANGLASIVIPHASLQPFFDPNKAVVERIRLEITVVEHRHILADRHIQIVAKIGLALFPEKAGTVTVTTYTPTYGWVFAESKDTPHVASGDGESGSTVRQWVDVPGSGVINPSNGSQMLRNPVAHCLMKFDSTTPCTPPRNGWFELKEAPIVINNGTRAEWEGKGYHQPKFIWMSYDRFEYKTTGDTTSSKQYDLVSGKNLYVNLPDGYDRYTIEGKSVTFQTISLADNASSPLMHFDHVTHEPSAVAIYQIIAPQD